MCYRVIWKKLASLFYKDMINVLCKIYRLCYKEEIWHHEKNTGTSGRCKICEKLSVHFRIVSVKINYIFGYIGFQNQGQKWISAAVYTVEQLYSSPPLSLFATFRPLTAAGFESCIPQAAATTAGQATHYLLPTWCTAWRGQHFLRTL